MCFHLICLDVEQKRRCVLNDNGASGNNDNQQAGRAQSKRRWALAHSAESYIYISHKKESCCFQQGEDQLQWMSTDCLETGRFFVSPPRVNHSSINRVSIPTSQTQTASTCSKNTTTEEKKRIMTKAFYINSIYKHSVIYFRNVPKFLFFKSFFKNLSYFCVF